MTTTDNKSIAAEAGAVTLEKLPNLGSPVESTAIVLWGKREIATEHNPYEIAAWVSRLNSKMCGRISPFDIVITCIITDIPPKPTTAEIAFNP